MITSCLIPFLKRQIIKDFGMKVVERGKSLTLVQTSLLKLGASLATVPVRAQERVSLHRRAHEGLTDTKTCRSLPASPTACKWKREEEAASRARPSQSR